MPDTHITDQKARLYMSHRKTQTRQLAAARAGIGAASAPGSTPSVGAFGLIGDGHKGTDVTGE